MNRSIPPQEWIRDAQGLLLPDWLQRCAQNLPVHLAIKCGDVSWSFAELERQATRLARQFAAIGIG